MKILPGFFVFGLAATTRSAEVADPAGRGIGERLPKSPLSPDGFYINKVWPRFRQRQGR